MRFSFDFKAGENSSLGSHRDTCFGNPGNIDVCMHANSEVGSICNSNIFSHCS